MGKEVGGAVVNSQSISNNNTSLLCENTSGVLEVIVMFGVNVSVNTCSPGLSSATKIGIRSNFQ